MRFLLTSLRLDLKQRLRSLLLLLVASLAVAGIAGAFSAQGESLLSIRVGLVFDADDADATELISSIPQADAVEYVLLRERAEAARLVATGSLECAYVLPSNWRERIRNGEVGGTIGLIRSSRTVADALVGKWLFTAVVASIAPEITADELASILDLPAEDIRPEVEELYHSYAEQYQFVTTEVSWFGEAAAEPDPPPRALSRPLCGLTALLMLVGALTALPAYLGGKQRMRVSLSSDKLALYYLSVLLSVLLRVLVIGFAASAMLRLTAGQVLPSVALSAYAAALAALTILLAILLRPTGLLFSYGVFYLICCLLLGGVLADPAELGGLFIYLSRLFPTAYLIDSALHGASALPLLLIALISGMTGAAALFLKAVIQKPPQRI